MKLGDALRTFSAGLTEITEDAALETRLMIQKATGLSRPVLLSRPEIELSDEAESQIRNLCRRRREGFPLPYLLGEWEFYGHTFLVDPSVLIPRPETEMLVEQASSWLKLHPGTRHAFDIGTGSGCIAVSLLLAFPDLQVTAIDLKRDALKTACKNASLHQCSPRFHPVQGDLFSAFGPGAGLVILAARDREGKGNCDNYHQR